MDFYRLSFITAPATEGEDFEYLSGRTCADCGLRCFPITHQFLVPEDTVSVLHLEADDSALPSIFEAAGMLVAQDQIVKAMSKAGITGFDVRPVMISIAESDPSVSCYRWLAITGRCTTNPVWERVVSVCPTCGMEKTERVTSSQRIVTIVDPKPTTDFFRSRERAAGIMITEVVRGFLVSTLSKLEDEVHFSKLRQS